MTDRDTSPQLPPEAPEADVLEQSRDVAGTTGPAMPSPGPEVPEADAWEQAQEVPADDDWR